MAGKKTPPKAQKYTELSLIENAFRRIPRTQAEVLQFIRNANNARERNGQELLSEPKLIDAAALHFRKLASTADPTLGIHERPHGTPSGYDNSDKAHVLGHIRQAVTAMRKAANGALDEGTPLGFVGRGLAATLLLEGGAMTGARASHTDTKGSFGGLLQVGAHATFEAWAQAQELANTMAAVLPKEHPYHNVKLEGAAFWKNVNAVHVQMAIACTHMKPLLDRMGKIPDNLLSARDKSTLMPIANSIPLVARKVIERMEKGEKLEDIKPSDMPEPTKAMMANNPREYVSDTYMAAEKEKIAERKKNKLPPLKLQEIMAGRIANLKPTMRAVLDAVDENGQKDAVKMMKLAGEDVSHFSEPPAEKPAAPAKAAKAELAKTPAGSPMRTASAAAPAIPADDSRKLNKLFTEAARGNDPTKTGKPKP